MWVRVRVGARATGEGVGVRRYPSIVARTAATRARSVAMAPSAMKSCV